MAAKFLLKTHEERKVTQSAITGIVKGQDGLFEGTNVGCQYSTGSSRPALST